MLIAVVTAYLITNLFVRLQVWGGEGASGI